MWDTATGQEVIVLRAVASAFTLYFDLINLAEEDYRVQALRQREDVRSSTAWLTLASWIGGDRDGNPNVTASVTAETGTIAMVTNEGNGRMTTTCPPCMSR